MQSSGKTSEAYGDEAYADPSESYQIEFNPKKSFEIMQSLKNPMTKLNEIIRELNNILGE